MISTRSIRFLVQSYYMQIDHKSARLCSFKERFLCEAPNVVGHEYGMRGTGTQNRVE